MSKTAVILFPGSNCELEAVRACFRSNLAAEIFRWNDDYSKLKNYDAYIIPGGFSYEDRGRSGVIASKDPLMEKIKHEAGKGKPLLGICNGAQILVETGLIPGLTHENIEMALAWNERLKKGKILGVGFYNDWVFIRHNSKPGRSVFNNFSSSTIMRVPVAHGEGRFTTREKGLLPNLIKNDQALFRYCDANGKFTADFPVNPNGAIYNLAGICNPEGHIMALMPHPERTVLGQPLFDSLANHLHAGKKILVKPLPQKIKIKPVTESIQKLKQKPDITILIELIITDNEEKTIENTLRRLNFKNIRLKRKIFLGLHLKNKKALTATSKLTSLAEKLLRSGEILNLHKEIPTIFINKKTYGFSTEKGLTEIKNPLSPGFHFFVTEYNNYSGKSIQANLQHHLKNITIEKIEKGVFWTVLQNKNINEIINTHIFHNTHSMKLVAFDS